MIPLRTTLRLIIYHSAKHLIFKNILFFKNANSYLTKNNPVVNTLTVSSLTLFNHMGNIILRLMHNLKEKLNSQFKKKAVITHLFVNLKND